jgi:hypothetical protein
MFFVLDFIVHYLLHVSALIAVLFVMTELIGGCSHLISPYGVLYGCNAVFSVDVYWTPCCINVDVQLWCPSFV